MKSARRNKAEGTLDKIAGRALELISKVTGRGSTKAKGKAARARGAGRKATGGAKTKASRARSSTRTTKGTAKSKAKSR